VSEGSRADTGKKDFRFGDYCLSWHHIEQAFQREIARAEHKCTRLKSAAVYSLDSFSKMRVCLAKAVMDARVAAEMLGWSFMATETLHDNAERDVVMKLSAELEKLPQRHINVSKVRADSGVYIYMDNRKKP
jgi:hypothetical protein